ncbi:MAG TPA: TIGR02266 family protein [Myxococcales bacterium]|jgi:type IV pilus assembly protein PilZ|nr:TIGR02266 family protein [Myxococcales bacterium]
MADLRQSARAPLRLRVDYERMNSFFADYTKDISKGGTFIKTERPLELGTRCQFTFVLPALSEPLVLLGEVAWILPVQAARARNEDPGMGVRFIFESPEAEKDFEELIGKMMEDALGPEVAHRLLNR